MSEIITVGLDLAKSVLQAHGADASCIDPAESAQFKPLI